jgi:hypothetical protein
VAQNYVKIMGDIEKLEPLTDDFTHFQLIQKTQNTRTQYTSANITLPPQEHFCRRSSVMSTQPSRTLS